MTLLNVSTPKGRSFSDGYRLAVFQVWYRLGKPTATVLLNHIEADPLRNERPTYLTLKAWITTIFAEQAEMLDRQVQQAIQERLVQEKVQMLEKHARVANKMQDMALDFLEENKENLKVPNAVRLLVEGIRIERESRGIPQALEKIVKLSDEDLIKQVTEIISAAPVTIEALDDEE